MKGCWLTGLAVLGVAVSAAAQTQETLERSFEVSGRSEIVVRNEDGRTRLSSHSGTEIRVQATKEVRRASSEEEALELAEQVEVRIEQTGNRIEVQTIYPRVERWWHREARVLVHLEIQAPRSSDLDIESEDGSQTIEGFDGRLRLTSEDGDLRVSDCSGELIIDVEDGDVELTSISGGVEAQVEDGDLDVEGRLASLQAESQDGSIHVRLAPSSAMQRNWSVRAEDGRIRLDLPEGFAADLHVRVDDGTIDIEPPVTVRGKLSNRELTTSLNGGGHELEVRTSDGSVRITQP